jgi:hypothetical protein
VLIGVLAALVACVGYGVSSVLQAYGARQSAAEALRDNEPGHVTDTGGPTLRYTIAAALTVAFIVGSCLDVVGFFANLVAARLIPLFLSQTIVSANLVVTAVFGIWLLHIGLRARDWIAIATVIISLVVLGLASGERGDTVARHEVHWFIFFASVVILGGGLWLIRVLGARAAVVAGLLAGVLFGVLAIGSRILDGVEPFRLGTLIADPAAWTIAIAGVGGFYLHTVALQLGSVNGATAALVVGETVVPGIVGTVLLGDSSQPGLGWVVVVGFVGAVAGAVCVAIFGASAPSPQAVVAPQH